MLCGNDRYDEDESLRGLGEGLRSKSLLRSVEILSLDRLRSTEARSRVICGVLSSFCAIGSSESSGETELAELCVSREDWDERTPFFGGARFEVVVVLSEACFGLVVCGIERSEFEEFLARTAKFDSTVLVFSRAIVANDWRALLSSVDTASLLPVTLVELWELLGCDWWEESKAVGALSERAGEMVEPSKAGMSSFEARNGETVVEGGGVRFDGSDI